MEQRAERMEQGAWRKVCGIFDCGFQISDFGLKDLIGHFWHQYQIANNQ
jgi:hypothetical protein